METTQHLVYLMDNKHLSHLPNESIQITVTSPPYVTTEFKRGQEFDYDGFLSHFGRVCRDIFRVTVPGGRFALNIADSGANSGGGLRVSPKSSRTTQQFFHSKSRTASSECTHTWAIPFLTRIWGPEPPCWPLIPQTGRASDLKLTQIARSSSPAESSLTIAL